MTGKNSLLFDRLDAAKRAALLARKQIAAVKKEIVAAAQLDFNAALSDAACNHPILTTKVRGGGVGTEHSRASKTRSAAYVSLIGPFLSNNYQDNLEHPLHHEFVEAVKEVNRNLQHRGWEVKQFDIRCTNASAADWVLN